MSTDNDNITSETTPNKKKNTLKRIYKISAWSVGSLIALILIALSCVLWYLTPERLTPIVEEYANEYLNAKVSVERVELTFWSTFPEAHIKVDSIEIISHSLDSIDTELRQKLPASSDSLLFIEHLHGGINLTDIISGKISLYDIEIHRPKVNLVIADSINNNFNIIPPSADTATTETTTIPDISIDKFLITEAYDIKFTSLSDSINASIGLNTLNLTGDEAPTYTITIKGDAGSNLLEEFKLNPFELKLNGGIEWDNNNPLAININDLTIELAELSAIINSNIDMNNNMVINDLNIKLPNIPIDQLLKYVPDEYINEFKLGTINTNMAIATELTLKEPYNLNSNSLPSVDLNIDIPNCTIHYDEYDIDEFSTITEFSFIGKDINSSIINVKKLNVLGMGINIDMNGRLSSLLSDPLFDGKIKGGINFEKLPQTLISLLPGAIKGQMQTDTDIKFRNSYITHNGFHKIKVNGNISIADFEFISNDTTTNIYADNIIFKLGTNNSFDRNNYKVDSLLTATITIDSARILQDKTRIILAGFKAGAGTKNIQSSTDSTQINPFGGSITLKKLNFISPEDSIRARLRDVKCFATLKRFKQMSKIPELILKFDAKRINFGDNNSRITLNESDILLNAHLRPRRELSSRMRATIDSIRTLNPELTNDSIYKLAFIHQSKKNRRNMRIPQRTDAEYIDFGDTGLKKLLQRWDISGHLKAKRGRLFTPYFPLRNTIKNFNVAFNNDSITLQEMTYTVGKSDFSLTGKINNIRQAVTSRRPVPLSIVFNSHSDTIDVNEISAAVFAGSAYSEAAIKTSIAEIEDESQLEQAIMQQANDTATYGALLVPLNLNAKINLNADNLIYANLIFNDFSGEMSMYRGALNLQNLKARNDIGSAELSALYTAPNKRNMRFGFSLQLDDIYIDKFIGLMPAIDSIMPMMKEFSGIINADVALTTDIDTTMNLVLPSMTAAIKLSGDSLVLLDAETFKSLSKWLIFKNKKRNMIDSMNIEILVEDSQLELFPFMFDIDRYRLGIMGSNDMAMNYDYHISVLKSPLPFKFGLNVKGNPDDMKIRVGKAKFKENMVSEKVAIVDTTRINLISQIKNVFRRGADAGGGLKHIRFNRPRNYYNNDINGDTISHADSLLLIKEGLIAVPQRKEDELNSK